MLIIGITGKMGAGKTTVSKKFSKLGIPIFDADKEVHRLLQNNKTLQKEIEQVWPQAIVNHTISHSILGKDVFSKKEEIFMLEKIIYKYLSIELEFFLKTKARNGFKEVILDIPLLYETNLNKICDRIILIIAPYSLRYARVMKRSKMTPEKFKDIENLFLKDEQKKADFKIRTGAMKHNLQKEIKEILSLIRTYSPKTWNQGISYSIERIYFGA